MFDLNDLTTEQVQKYLMADNGMLQELNEFRQVLIDAGYEIVPPDSYTKPDSLYMTIVKDRKFLHLTESTTSRWTWTITSVYKPSKIHGTGTVIAESSTLSLALIESCADKACMFFVSPGSDNPVFYKDMEDYLKFNQAWYKS